MNSSTPTPHQDIGQIIAGPVAVIIVIAMIALAVAAILIIWYGSIQRRRRIEAERQVEEDRRIAEAAGATAPAQETDPNQPDGGSLKTARAETPQPVAAPQTEPLAEPAVETAPKPVAATAPTSGDLTQLKGLGPKLAATLAELGYTRIEQIAALTPEDAAMLDAQLGSFQGRMARDRWIEQAKLLSAGDRAGYEAAFGKL